MANFRKAYIAEAFYVTEGAAEKRAPFRPKHLDRIAKLHREGALLLGGPCEDMVSAFLVLAVETEEAARAIVETDVYFKNKVWTHYTVRQLNVFEPDPDQGG